MRVLFMSLSDYRSISFNGLYTNLLRQFTEHGDEVYLLSPVEKKNEYNGPWIIKEGNSTIVKFRIGNIQKTNIIEKGINILAIEPLYIKAIKRYIDDIKFDLILYPTPPITLVKVVEYVKKKDGAKAYLLLKDIFPQNAVDIGMMKKSGIKGLIYKYFRKKEKRLYRISDYIGCMSKANVDYLLKNNPEINKSIVEVCPNTTDATDMSVNNKEKEAIRRKYGIPNNKTVFVYGGNLGKPQGIPFLLECLKSQANNPKSFFIIIGSGTEYSKIEKFLLIEKPNNIKLLNRMPKDDYDRMVGSCDVGLIFLDHRFTIPNFPSRLLAYTQAKIPVIAATDPNTDIGAVIQEGKFGWWCESDSVNSFNSLIENANTADLKQMGENGYRYMIEHYTNEIGYRIIMEHMKGC